MKPPLLLSGKYRIMNALNDQVQIKDARQPEAFSSLVGGGKLKKLRKLRKHPSKNPQQGEIEETPKQGETPYQKHPQQKHSDSRRIPFLLLSDVLCCIIILFFSASN